MKTITYDLKSKQLPTIPVVHDCIVKKIECCDNELVFIFEDDITYHDGMCQLMPSAKSLTIRFELEDKDSMVLYRWKKSRDGKGYYKLLDSNEIVQLTEYSLEYLYHYLGYSSMMIKLYAKGSILLELDVKRVEYIWRD